MKPFDKQLVVIENKAVAKDIFRMTFDGGGEAAPGQFVMVKVTAGLDPLLRRPFSLHAVTDKGQWQILYRVVGKGTRLMTAVKAGQRLEIVGPLGKGFQLPPPDEKTITLIGGGIGVAPLPQLVPLLRDSGINDISVLFGFRNAEEIVCEEYFVKKGVSVAIATENGSRGINGLVTSLLPKGGANYIYCCGPMPMMKAVAGLCMKNGWSGQFSLEGAMACGMEACLGCAVAASKKDKYWHVCQDGPVFEMEEIAWQQV